MCCSGCGRFTDKMHDTEERWVRELPILDAQTHLLVQRRRVACPHCGPKLEFLPWLEPYARVSSRLAAAVAQLCRTLTVKDATAYFDLGWDAVKAIYKAHLERTLNPPDLDGITEVVMDEFALHKGQRYATVVLEPKCRRVLWVGKGRDRESVRPFFELLGPERCAGIRAVGMDMSAAYAAEVRMHCPAARGVYDQFHVIAKYGREVIDPVRTAKSRRSRATSRAATGSVYPLTSIPGGPSVNAPGGLHARSFGALSQAGPRPWTRRSARSPTTCRRRR